MLALPSHVGGRHAAHHRSNRSHAGYTCCCSSNQHKAGWASACFRHQRDCCARPSSPCAAAAGIIGSCDCVLYYQCAHLSHRRGSSGDARCWTITYRPCQRRNSERAGERPCLRGTPPRSGTPLRIRTPWSRRGAAARTRRSKSAPARARRTTTIESQTQRIVYLVPTCPPARRQTVTSVVQPTMAASPPQLLSTTTTPSAASQQVPNMTIIVVGAVGGAAVLLLGVLLTLWLRWRRWRRQSGESELSNKTEQPALGVPARGGGSQTHQLVDYDPRLPLAKTTPRTRTSTMTAGKYTAGPTSPHPSYSAAEVSPASRSGGTNPACCALSTSSRCASSQSLRPKEPCMPEEAAAAVTASSIDSLPVLVAANVGGRAK